MEKLLKEILEKLNVTMTYLYVATEGDKVKSLMDIYQEIKRNQPPEENKALFDIDADGNEELINKLALQAQRDKKFIVSKDRQWIYIESDAKVYRVSYARFVNGKIG